MGVAPDQGAGTRICLRALGTALVLALLAAVHSGAARASDAGGHTPSADDRYSIVNGCFALQSLGNSLYVTTSGSGYAATAATPGAAAPFRMQATDLGKYLFYDPNQEFLGIDVLGTSIESAAAPSDSTDWTVLEDGSDFRIKIGTSLGDRYLAVGGGGTLVAVPTTTPAGLFDFADAGGCPEYPEIEVNVSGPQPATHSPTATVSGFVETHMHQMAFEFLGSQAHCGRPWHRFGAPYALVDCADHGPDGCAAVLEQALSGPGCHDPGGWPSFAGWPRNTQYTHEQSYYKWLERSWRGGLKIFVNLLVENRILCELYPIKPVGHDCDEMETVRREAQDMHDLEDYIDAQNGGPGKGWFRIVDDPVEARQVINDGKLAVVMGMEVSEPFGCILNATLNMSECTEAELDAGIDEVYDLGVRQLEIVNKFDNGLTGVAGDSGTTGVLTNGGNFLSSQQFWDYEHCDEPVNHDHAPTGLPDEVNHSDDALGGAVLDLYSSVAPPNPLTYGSPPYCNQRGLSDLGEHAIERFMDKKMLFDPDHQSVVGRNEALDLIEAADYPGVMTSHSWSTDNALPRIAQLGGLIGPSTGSSQGYVSKWAHMKLHGYDAMNPYLFGLGYGADMNGFASQGGPRNPAEDDDIDYPFASPVEPGVMIDKQISGQRSFDINTDGVAHYGLYPDWIQDVCMVGGQAILNDMARGAEAYLQMWERTTGAPSAGGTPDQATDCRAASGGGSSSGDGGSGSAGGCKAWPRRFTKAGLKQRLRLGYDQQTTLAKAGQPGKRHSDRVWEWCVQKRAGAAKKRVVAVFDEGGRVAVIASTLRNARAGSLWRGSSAGDVKLRAKSLGKGLWGRDAGAGDFFYRLRKGKIAYIGVASGPSAQPGTLRSQLKLAGLR